MARIPQTQFGNQVTRPGPMGNVAAEPRGVRVPGVEVPPTAFVDGTGQALNRAGGMVQEAAARELIDLRRQEAVEAQRKEAERKQNEAQARRNAGAKAFATYQVESEEAFGAVAADLTEGRLKRDDFAGAWQKRRDEIRKRTLDGLDPDVRASIEDNLILADGRTDARSRDLLGRHARDERLAGFNGTLEALSRQALTDRGRAVKQAEAFYSTEGVSLLGEEGARKGMQAFRETAAANFHTEALARSKNDYRGLQALDKAIREDGDLDPGRKVALSGQIQSRLAVMQHQAQVQAEATQRRAKGEFDSLTALLDRGVRPDDAMVARVTAATRGTPYADAVGALLKDSGERAGFGAAPVTAQAGELERLYAERTRKGSNPELEKRIATLEGIHRATVTDYKEDPWNAGLQRGHVAEIPPLDLGDIPGSLARRMAAVAPLDVAAGRKVSPLRPDEAESLARLLASQPIDQRAATLKEIGKAVGDPVRLRALGQQMGKGSSTMATAAFLAAAELQHTERKWIGPDMTRSVADLYLRGEDALATNRVKVDQAKETGTKAQIMELIGDAYSTPAARDAAADVAFKVWAAERAAGRDSARRAVEIATGGIYEGDGWKVPKPYGMSDADFRKALREYTPARVVGDSMGRDLKAGGVTLKPEEVARAVSSGRLREAGGEYVLQIGANIVTVDGKPFRVRVP